MANNSEKKTLICARASFDRLFQERSRAELEGGSFKITTEDQKGNESVAGMAEHLFDSELLADLELKPGSGLEIRPLRRDDYQRGKFVWPLFSTVVNNSL